MPLTGSHVHWAGDEGFAFGFNRTSVFYRELSVSLPRVDDVRRADYHEKLARYAASRGSFAAIDEQLDCAFWMALVMLLSA